MFITLLFGGWAIQKLKEFQIGQHIREEGPALPSNQSWNSNHGRLIIIAGILIPTLLWADLLNPFIWILLFALLSFGAIGFMDDYVKLAKRRNLGITVVHKFALQILCSILIGGFLLYLSKTTDYYNTRLNFPFIKWWQPDLGYFYIALVIVVIVGASNAVNLTDGL